MEADRPDPWEPFLDLVRRLPEDVRQPLGNWLDGVVDALRSTAGPAPVTGHLAVVQDDQMMVAHGTAFPATVTIQPAVLKLSAGEVTLTAGPPPVSPWVRWPPEAVRVALVLYVLGWVALICHPDPDPIPVDVNALIGARSLARLDVPPPPAVSRDGRRGHPWISRCPTRHSTFQPPDAIRLSARSASSDGSLSGAFPDLPGPLGVVIMPHHRRSSRHELS